MVRTVPYGTSDSMRNISQKTINTIPIALVDKKLQKEIIEIEQNIEFQLNTIENAHKQALNDLDILPSKLLAQAFSAITIE
jgi:restriction endonuclease S subunit